MKKVSGGTTTLYFYDTEGKLIEEYIPATGAGKDYLWIPKSYEPVARVDFSMTDADTGDVLRCSKSSPNVHLDWSLFSGGGNFVMRRGIIGDFSSYSNIFGPSALKTCDDPVLENTTSYWYDTRNRSLTDNLYFYHCDHLGTPITMTDTNGTLVWRAEHTPFGSIYALPVSTVDNNLRFPGQYFDSETGLAQNWFRDYEAKIGRYWEVDPARVIEKRNPYTYADLNPVQVTDFSGLQGSVSLPGKRAEIKVCCRLLRPFCLPTGPFRHCYISVNGETWGLYPINTPSGKKGMVSHNDKRDKGGICKTTQDCEDKKSCIEKAVDSYPNYAAYSYTGPNCNTFASYEAKKCKLKTPLVANIIDSPGWGGTPPAPAQ